MMFAARPSDQTKLFAIILVALIALAWLALWLWGRSPYGRFLSHEHLDQVSLDDSLVVLVFVAGWTLMTVAMMLPTTLPLVLLFHRLTQRRVDRYLLVILLLAGYLSIWALFGAVVHTGDWVLHHVVDGSPWLTANSWVIGAATLLLAGAYQFTPLKYHCLDKCRSPLSFITEYWSGRQERQQSFRLGVDHGLFCVGCCWSLMLLMFGIGVGNLGWMLALGAVMAVEKNLPWGRCISAPLGAGLLLWGATLAVTGGAL